MALRKRNSFGGKGRIKEEKKKGSMAPRKRGRIILSETDISFYNIPWR